MTATNNNTMLFAITPTLRRRLFILAGLVFTLWAAWQVSKDEAPVQTVPASRDTTQRHSSLKTPPAAPVLSLVWPVRGDLHEPVADLFTLTPAPVLAPSVVAGSPAVLPLNLKYIGRLDGSDNSHVFLTDSKDQVISAQVGQAVADDWKLTAMDAKQLVFRHTATGQEQTMLIGTVQ